MHTADYILAFDTANEVVSVALGRIHAEERTVECVAFERIMAHRASNTKLLPAVDALLAREGIERSQIGAVACGRGPGSFTGVRICMATAKGIAAALEVALVGVSTLDALAWELQAQGQRGRVLVVADAMRREVYPQVYQLTDEGIERAGADTVVPAADFELTVSDDTDSLYATPCSAAQASPSCAALLHTFTKAAPQPGESSVQRVATSGSISSDDEAICFDLVAGDALAKYADAFAPYGPFAPQECWTVEGPGLLACVQQMWQEGTCDPLNARRHDPAFALPIYTRLSDAEENERARLATEQQRNLQTGVGNGSLRLAPLSAQDAPAVASLEAAVMAGDAWNQNMVLDDLGRKDRGWWGAYAPDGSLLGYAGGQVIDGQLQLFKIAVAENARRQGVATQLLAQLADDARNLGADEMTLEVRAGNDGARQFYEQVGLKLEGVRPGYYQDGQDAAIYTGPLPQSAKDIAGMELVVGQAEAQQADQKTNMQSPTQSAKPRILAIESSCDETAAAVIDGEGHILADTVASQIDFHARFGGVVPEIASRKHIEAICGVAQVCLERAGVASGAQAIRYRDLDAIAVTYAPGLVGALVVGVAFAKGAAWAANIPLIQVNHLEGHLYANKFATPDLQPPMVASLVSGGHTMLVHVRNWGDYRVLGSTIDDAVGEAFDKVAKALGLGYPGGPIISQLAQEGNSNAIDFPRAMMHSGDLRFSLSGLKTAVTTYINQQREAGAELNLPDIAASFQAAVIDVQVAKACTALDETGAKEFCLGGGVASNPALREAYEQACKKRGVRLTMPPASACTDNASMIALVALDRYAQQRFATLDADAYAHTNLEEPY